MSTLIRRILDRAIAGPQPSLTAPAPRHRGVRHPEDWPAPETTTPALQHSVEAVARQEALR